MQIINVNNEARSHFPVAALLCYLADLLFGAVFLSRYSSLPLQLH